MVEEAKELGGVAFNYYQNKAKNWVKRKTLVPAAKLAGKAVDVCEYVYDKVLVKPEIWKRNRHERGRDREDADLLKASKENSEGKKKNQQMLLGQLGQELL